MLEKREQWVDSIKIFACILVTLGHFFQSMLSAGIMNDNNIYQWFNQTIYIFHVSLFFICSGYLYQKRSIVNDAVSWINNLVKRLLTLGVPYFAFTLISYIFKTVFADSVNSEVGGGLAVVLFCRPILQYWYLYALLFIFIATPTAASKGMAIIELAIALILKIIDIIGVRTGIPPIAYIMKHSIWFVIGMNIEMFNIPEKPNKYIQTISGIILFALFILISIFIYRYNINSPAILFILGCMACIGLTFMAMGLLRTKKYSKSIGYAAKYIMPVYLMHTIFAAGIRIVLIKIGIDNFAIHCIVGISFSIAGSVLATEIMCRVRGMDFILYPTKYMKGNILRKQ